MACLIQSISGRISPSERRRFELNQKSYRAVVQGGGFSRQGRPDLGRFVRQSVRAVPERIIGSITACGSLRHRLSIILFIAPAALAPLPYGSVDNTTIALWMGSIAVSLLLADPGNVKRSQWLAVAAIAAWLVGAIGLIVIQHAIETDPIRLQAHDLLAALGGRTASAPLAAPLRDFGAPLLFAIVAMRGVLIGADRRGTVLLLRSIGYAAVVFALFGIVQLVLAPDYVLFRHKVAYVGVLTGPFINRNTAATFFGSAALLWTAILDERWQRAQDRRRKAKSGLSPEDRSSLIRAGAAVLVTLFAVMLTRSRGGFVLTTALMFAFASFNVLRRRQAWSRSLRVRVLLGLFFGGLALLQILGGSIAARIQDNGLADPNRWRAYLSSWKLVLSHPLIGVGWGGFESAFPSVRSSGLGFAGIWDRAHSTPLELLIETGVPFTALTVALWLALAVPLFRSVWQPDGPVSKAVISAAAAVALLGTVQSSFDFSLQIPGYAVVFASIVGAGIGVALNQDGRCTPIGSKAA